MLLSSILFFGATAAFAAPTCTRATGNNTVALYLSPGAIAGLQLALYLENLEVNFFRSASANITHGEIAQGISNATLDAISVAAQVC
jgi:hypothetical protein